MMHIFLYSNAFTVYNPESKVLGRCLDMESRDGLAKQSIVGI